MMEEAQAYLVVTLLGREEWTTSFKDRCEYSCQRCLESENSQYGTASHLSILFENRSSEMIREARELSKPEVIHSTTAMWEITSNGGVDFVTMEGSWAGYWNHARVELYKVNMNTEQVKKLHTAAVKYGKQYGAGTKKYNLSLIHI